MSQSGSDVRIDRLDIQRAQSAVLVEQDGVEYAIVADDNYNYLDPYMRAMYEAPMFEQLTPFGPPTPIGGSASAKKVAVGGKLGIVKDPFGKQGTPTYLGATLPLDGYGIVNLSLSENGKVLIGQLKGGYSANIFDMAQKPNQSHAWNVQALIEAATKNPSMTNHLTLAANAEQLVPTNAAPVAGTGFDPDVLDVSYTGRMGDVLELDLKGLAEDAEARRTAGLPPASVLPLKAMTREQLTEYNNVLGVIEELHGFEDFHLDFMSAFLLTNEKLSPFKLVSNGIVDGEIQPYSRANPIAEEPALTPAAFRETGRMYLVPTITDAELSDLRAGRRIEDKSFQLEYRYKIREDGMWHTARVKVTAKDIERVNTFFGDRPLDNPGYSKFELRGSVGVGAGNLNDRLDVYRVEQRLKYLGFPAMGTGYNGTSPTLQNAVNDASQHLVRDTATQSNESKPFRVDGNWEVADASAALLFGKVVGFNAQDRQLVTPAGRVGKATNAVNYFSALDTAARQVSVSAATTLQWLNAYNAPHWMQLFDQGARTNPQLRGWSNAQTGGANESNVERFGTSWLRDLMAAKNYAPPGLRQNGSLFNGAADANHGYTPFGHGTHDLGMAFDLGVRYYISPTYPNPNWTQGSALPRTLPGNQNDATALTAAQTIARLTTGRAWSNANAATMSNNALLPTARNTAGINNQQAALRDFLSLYAVTRDDTADSRLQLPVQGGSTPAQTDLIRTALFGEGTNATSLIEQVLIGGTGNAANPYVNINNVLYNLGITSGTSGGHETHFHVYLRPPVRQVIIAPQNLLADVSTFDKEHAMMLDMDVNPAPATQIVAASQVVDGNVVPVAAALSKELKACQDVESAISGPGVNNLLVVQQTAGALGYKFNKENGRYDQSAKEFHRIADLVRVVSRPLHGSVVRMDGDFPVWQYIPEVGYVGKDRVSFFVEANGKRVLMTYNLWVTPVINERQDGHQDCDFVKFGQVPVDWSLDSLKALVNMSGFLSAASSIELGFDDLQGSSVGTTVGEGPTAQITLDSNAAGHGWYIDPTPLDNTDDYLPTSSPNIWQAKAGSEADGKMDLLSVLLHEYGHALGLEHAADSADYMAATLQPGQRRLPSSEELSLMSQLLAQLKASAGLADGSEPTPPNPSAPLGAVLIGRLALGRRPEDDALASSSQALFSANPTLQGGSLATLQDWATQGKVVAESANTGNASTPTGATLAESTTTQTRLNQVFMLKPEDRYLSFTLRNLALDDAADGPDDAFEAALLNANTGANLLSPLALSHTDALLNLQAGQGGTGSLAELAAQGVSHVTHPDGSRTYLVDLSGIERDADGSVAVNLSFDLIGFGNTPQSMGSHVQVSDVRLLGAVQTVDDSASTAEDTALTIQAQANDIGATPGTYTPTITSAPAHGSVSIQADGSFLYTPEANYYGADSFSYQLGNNAITSNTATVSLTVTPANDGPTLGNQSLTVAEAAAAVERSLAALRAKARVKVLRLGPQAVEHLPSFSYGLASFPQDGADQQTLIACADARLYAMKSLKRDPAYCRKWMANKSHSRSSGMDLWL